MICGVMQMNRGTKSITLHSNQQQGERIAKTKTKIQPKPKTKTKTRRKSKAKTKTKTNVRGYY
jgi:hypothetical protein